jgi:hypothetical protein
VRAGLPDGIVGLMAVRQMRAGVRVRLPVGATSIHAALINSEALARSAYEFAAARVPKLANFERAARESAP